MLCPLLPGIADAPEQIDELVRFVADCGAEEVFSEAVNARGNSLTLTEQKAPGQRLHSRVRGSLDYPQAKGVVNIRRRSVGEYPAGDAEAHDD